MVRTRRGRCTVECRVRILLKNSLLVEGQDVTAKDLHDVAADPGICCLGEVGRLAGRKHPAFR